MTEPLIHADVELGHEPDIGPFVVIGHPLRGKRAAKTRLGERARILSHSVIYAGTQIGDRFFCGHHVLIREFCYLGDDVSIGTGSVLEHDVTIEDGVRVHTGVFIPEFSILRSGCWVGPRVCLTNAKYPTYPGVKDNLRGPEIGAGAIIGANVTILPGVRIGERALVGAGAVVTADVEPGAVVAGNPARQVKTIDHLTYGD